MKIGIDCRLWNESGVGRYVRNLVQELGVLDPKNEYVLFTRSIDQQKIKYQISHSTSSGQANIKNNKNWKIVEANIRWHSLEEQIRFPQILNKENLDLIHFPYFSVPVFYKRPFIVTIHDLILHHFSTGEASTLPPPLYKFKHLGYKFIVLNSIKRAKKIISVSEATKKEIIEHFKIDSSKIIVTYEGVDEKISNIKYQISNIKIKKPYFLYVGNAYPHKNLERLIKAFNLLASTNPNLSLVLVGKEDFFYKRLKEKLKNMKLNNQIIFYADAGDDELSNLYKNAVALVFPSLMEGFGLPALEAMVLGCLVLASDIPSFHEICGDSAIYFNPYDINDITKKMKDVIHYNNTYHYSENIKKGIERAKMFSWEKMARETLRIYLNL